MTQAAAAQAPKRTRRDPRPRHSDGQATGADGTPRTVKLVNRREDMWYTYVYKRGDAVGEYESRGYDTVIYKPGGVRPMAVRKGSLIEGQPIEFRDHVLMAIPLEEHERIEAEGEDGNTGQALADRIERRIRASSAASLREGNGKERIIGAGGRTYVRPGAAEIEDMVDEG